MVRRYELTKAQWERIADLLPGQAGDPGRRGADKRLFVNGVLWILRSGADWRHLPPRYGKYKSVRQRYTRWAKAGVWERVFAALVADPHNRYLMYDIDLVRDHRQAETGKEGPKTGLWGDPDEA